MAERREPAGSPRDAWTTAVVVDDWELLRLGLRAALGQLGVWVIAEAALARPGRPAGRGRRRPAAALDRRRRAGGRPGAAARRRAGGRPGAAAAAGRRDRPGGGRARRVAADREGARGARPSGRGRLEPRDRRGAVGVAGDRQD